MADAVQKQMHVGLLFGETDASEAALETTTGLVNSYIALADAIDLVGDELASALDKAGENIDTADDAHTTFLKAAHIAVRTSVKDG
jgi:hypothetical protein